MKAVVAAFNQEKALVGAFSVITNLRMELFEALVGTVKVKKGNISIMPSPGRCGLLGPGTILAHCVHLSTAEVELLRATGAGVSHCPNSNFTLKSGVCDVQRLKKAGVKVWIHSVIIASRLFISFNTEDFTKY